LSSPIHPNLNTQEAEEIAKEEKGAEKNFKKLSAVIQLLEKQFHTNYHITSKLKFKAVMIEDVGWDDEEDVALRIRFGNELFNLLDVIDPGTTRMWRAVAGQTVKARLVQLKREKEEGKLTKEQYLKEVARCVTIRKA
jgi:hypothetical protein